MMKKYIIMLIALAAPLLAAAQGGLYERYAKRADLRVAEVSGLRLNDTVRTDALLLAATSDEAWRQLCAEMGVLEATGTTTWLAPVGKPAERTRWDGGAVLRVVASHERRTVAIYAIESEAQYDALLDYQMNSMERNAKKKVGGKIKERPLR